MPKNQHINILKKHFILLLAILYLVAPLKNVFLESLHEIDHLFAQTNAKHSHQLAHDHQEEHTHEHKMVSFFSTLFSSESDKSNSNKVMLYFEVEKHIVYKNDALQLPPLPFKIHSYFYTSEAYNASFRNTTPPPEVSFS